jgi:hypothetical protein
MCSTGMPIRQKGDLVPGFTRDATSLGHHGSVGLET